MQALDLVVTWLWSFIFCLGIFIVLVVAICFAWSKRSFVVIKNFATDLVVFGLLFLICLLSWIGGSLCLYQLLVNDCPIKVCIQNFHYVWVATFGQNVDFCEEALQALTFVHHLFRAHYLNSNLLVRLDINCQLDPINKNIFVKIKSRIRREIWIGRKLLIIFSDNDGFGWLTLRIDLLQWS
jgi:hypothetical protein